MKRTHIPKLDELLGGGILDGISVMFCAYPGVDCEAFGYQMLNGRVNEGDNGFIFTNVSEPETIQYEFDSYGWDLESFIQEDKVFFVDGSSSFLGTPSSAKYVVHNYNEVEDLILDAINEVPGGIGVINNLSVLIDYMEMEETLATIKKWNQKARENKTTLVYIFTEWDYHPDLIDEINNSMDCVVDLRTIEERVIIGQGFMVARATWTEPKETMVLFFVVQPGGVKVYVPKILVTGPYNSGKSSFVKSISEESVSVDRKAMGAFPTTIAMDIGHVDYKGFLADVFGTPGQERFDLILSVLSKEAVGAFILVDSTAPQTFARAKEMIRKTRAESIPKIIIANKQDLPDALSPEDIRKKMKISRDIPIVPAVVTEKKGIYHAMDALLKLIYGD
ncbi:GTP-binding protein [Methanobacterium alkalithermotolerans]|uniref:GTP-binding protein n=1 Tax=Methanobacterium alkalithermotolerans TaxID=2731220 RepID=A0A8T8KAB1_9EURY|nr:ATPase domain-containing protein [Methanobacterium alkalithermotolerans]QUH24023.1 GTP-binding protein [Methanobacterium alkalithermotolerans]